MRAIGYFAIQKVICAVSNTAAPVFRFRNSFLMKCFVACCNRTVDQTILTIFQLTSH